MAETSNQDRGILSFTVYDRCNDDIDVRKVTGGSILIQDGSNSTITIPVPTNINSTSYTYNYSYTCNGYSPEKEVKAFYLSSESTSTYTTKKYKCPCLYEDVRSSYTTNITISQNSGSGSFVSDKMFSYKISEKSGIDENGISYCPSISNTPLKYSIDNPTDSTWLSINSIETEDKNTTIKYSYTTNNTDNRRTTYVRVLDNNSSIIGNLYFVQERGCFIQGINTYFPEKSIVFNNLNMDSDGSHTKIVYFSSWNEPSVGCKSDTKIAYNDIKCSWNPIIEKELVLGASLPNTGVVSPDFTLGQLNKPWDGLSIDSSHLNIDEERYLIVTDSSIYSPDTDKKSIFYLNDGNSNYILTINAEGEGFQVESMYMADFTINLNSPIGYYFNWSPNVGSYIKVVGTQSNREIINDNISVPISSNQQAVISKRYSDVSTLSEPIIYTISFNLVLTTPTKNPYQLLPFISAGNGFTSSWRRGVPTTNNFTATITITPEYGIKYIYPNIDISFASMDSGGYIDIGDPFKPYPGDDLIDDLDNDLRPV